MPDLRPGIVTRLRGRSYGHLTPAYLYRRARHVITSMPAGFPGSRDPGNVCTPAFLADTAGWQRTWTSDGVTATLVMFKP